MKIYAPGQGCVFVSIVTNFGFCSADGPLLFRTLEHLTTFRTVGCQKCSAVPHFLGSPSYTFNPNKILARPEGAAQEKFLLMSIEFCGTAEHLYILSYKVLNISKIRVFRNLFRRRSARGTGQEGPLPSCSRRFWVESSPCRRASGRSRPDMERGGRCGSHFSPPRPWLGRSRHPAGKVTWLATRISRMAASPCHPCPLPRDRGAFASTTDRLRDPAAGLARRPLPRDHGNLV